MADVEVGLVPYGKLADGSHNFLYDSSTGQPLVSVMEVLATLPDTSGASNFPGRLVFTLDTQNIYIWDDNPSDAWIPLKSSAVEVDSGDPPLVPTPTAGDLFYSTTTKVLYLYDGSAWVAIGGERGAEVLWRHYTGDDVVDQFATGATTSPPVEYVQVYLDGVVQQPGSNGVRDYYMIGNDVKMNAVPSGGTAISIRTLTFIDGVRNSKFLTQRYTASGNSYDTGSIQIDPGQVSVYIDGVRQIPYTGGAAGTYDFRIATQDTTISTLTSSGTTCTAITAEAHGFTTGDTITISGALESEYNGTFAVATTPTSTSFTYTAAGTPSASPATPNPSIEFSPVKVNDAVVFVNSSGNDEAPPSGSIIHINTIENVTASSDAGEINTASNVGGGTGLYYQKDTYDLQFKSLVAGGNINLTDNGTSITIDENANRFMEYQSYNGTPTTYTVNSDNDVYIAVRNASGSAVTIDLVNIPTTAASTGRRIIIKDEAYNAGTDAINIKPGASSKIDDGVIGANYQITDDGGAVHLVMDGTDWHVHYREPGPAGAQGPTGLTGSQGPAGTWGTLTRTELDGTTDPYTVLGNDEYLAVNNTSGSGLTIEIESGMTAAGRRLTIKDEGRNANSYNITVDPGDTKTIDGGGAGADLTMNVDGQSVTIVYDGTNFHTI